MKKKGHRFKVREEAKFKGDLGGIYFTVAVAWKELLEKVVDPGAIAMFKMHIGRHMNR